MIRTCGVCYSEVDFFRSSSAVNVIKQHFMLIDMHVYMTLAVQLRCIFPTP